MVYYRWNNLPPFFTYMYNIILYVMEHQCLEFAPGIRQEILYAYILRTSIQQIKVRVTRLQSLLSYFRFTITCTYSDNQIKAESKEILRLLCN